MFTLGENVTIDEIIEKVNHSKSFIKASNGGVTVSGGEPLLQAKEVSNLFKWLHELGIHTCLDTAGSLPVTDDIKELLKFTDLVLLDIKHIDNEKSVDLVGVPNLNNLNFAKYLSDNNIPMWIRQVIIPGYTDDKQDLIKLKEFISSLKSVQKIELLPYHNLGKYKWDNLNLEYPLENVRTATAEDIKRASNLLGL